MERLEALRIILQEGELSTQEELRDKLEKQGFDVTQSTISRDLRKLGAVRSMEPERGAVYRLPADNEPPPVTSSISDLILDIDDNGSLIVIHTVVGSAPLVARHLDRVGPDEILGTLAGDDTLFVAPDSLNPRRFKATVAEIKKALQYVE